MEGELLWEAENGALGARWSEHAYPRRGVYAGAPDGNIHPSPLCLMCANTQAED